MKKVVGVDMRIGDVVSAERADITNPPCNCENCVQGRKWLDERAYLPEIEGVVIAVYQGVLDVEAIGDQFEVKQIISEPLCIIEDNSYGVVEVPMAVYRWTLLRRGAG